MLQIVDVCITVPTYTSGNSFSINSPVLCGSRNRLGGRLECLLHYILACGKMYL